jgi:hypothetical protein
MLSKISARRLLGRRAFGNSPKAPVKVAITGGTGNISYSIMFRLSSGEFLGKD